MAVLIPRIPAIEFDLGGGGHIALLTWRPADGDIESSKADPQKGSQAEYRTRSGGIVLKPSVCAAPYFCAEDFEAKGRRGGMDQASKIRALGLIDEPLCEFPAAIIASVEDPAELRVRGTIHGIIEKHNYISDIFSRMPSCVVI